MPMDLICPRCKSNKVNSYGQSIGKYGSSDARYVCENCGYIGTLILDVSKDKEVDKKKDKKINKDLEEIKKEIKKMEDDELLTDDGLDEKPFIPQPIPPEMERKIKILPADEHCDFIIYAKRTTFSQMEAFIFMCMSGAVFLILVFYGLKNQDFNVLDTSFLIYLAILAVFPIVFISSIQSAFFDDGWFVGTSKRLLKYRKNKVKDSFDWNELTEDIKVRGALEEGSIEIVTKRTYVGEYGICVVNIYLGGIKNPHKIEKLIRKRVILNSTQRVH